MHDASPMKARKTPLDVSCSRSSICSDENVPFCPSARTTESSGVGPERAELLAEYASAGQVQALKWWVSNEPGMDLIDLLLTMDRYCIALLNATDEA